MENSWCENEFQYVELGDKRLNSRLINISEKFAKSPLSPINQACSDWAETKAAYRFFSNDSVDYKNITKSHIENTRLRANQYNTILAIQDSSYFNYSSHPKTSGLCPLTKRDGTYRKEIITFGLVMHSTLAVGTDGTPLGILDQKIYSRDQLDEKKLKKKKKSHRTQTPIEQKDTYKWIEQLKSSNINITKDNGQTLRSVCVCDREGDMYDFFLEAEMLNANYLVRSSHNRTVNKKSRFSENTGIKLSQYFKKRKKITSITVKLPKNKDQPAREAICNVKIGGFSIVAPHNYTNSKIDNPPELHQYAVEVSEVNCPKNCEPLNWTLLTNIPIKGLSDAIEMVEWYCLRWRIETWHKIIKSGFKVEDCRLSTAERLIRYLAVISIVAWRVFWITLIARNNPNQPCSCFLTEMQWKILEAKFSKTKISGRPIPTIKQAVNWIARLGGYLSRNKDGPPGIVYIWRGLKTLESLTEGALLSAKLVGNS